MKIKCLYVYKCDPNTNSIAISGTPQCSDFHLLNKTIKKSMDFKNKLKEFVFSNPETLFEFYGTYEQASQNIGKDKLIRCLYTIFNKNEIEVRHARYSNFVKFKLKSNLQQVIDKIS